MSVNRIEKNLGQPLILEEEVLKETAKYIESDQPILAAKLLVTLRKGHIPQPPLEKGYSFQKYYQLDLDREEVQQVVIQLKKVEKNESQKSRVRWGNNLQQVSRVLNEWEETVPRPGQNLMQPPY